MIGTSLDHEEEAEFVNLLRKNIDFFAWQPSNMPGIDPNVVCHHLAVNPAVKPVVQRKHKLGEERRNTVDKEVKKLKDACFISEIKYPTWLENMVLMKKASGKWRMCVDYTI